MTVSSVSLSNVKSGAGLPSSTTESSSRRAIGVVRVSRVGDREGERFVSPSEQAERIRSACERDGLQLIDTIEELDVSGGTPLKKRAGLRGAVEMVEAGEADVLVVAFFDRLVRSLEVQIEVTKRVEAAGGYILALDIGEVRRDTAAKKLSSTFLAAVAEYHRDVTAERTQEAKVRAVARGVPPFPRIPPGYRLGEGNRLEPEPDTAATVTEAFRLRAAGATIMDVRAHLRDHGIDRSFHGTQAMLTSRIYLGELRFGDLVNPSSHPAIVDTTTWTAVQRARLPPGRRAKSERLLARLGVLRCATCGARLVVGTQTQNGRCYPFYRCVPSSDCPARVTIGAELVEAMIVDYVKDRIQGMRSTVSSAIGLEDAEREFDRAERDLDAAVEAFTGLEDVESARARLVELRDHRNQARERLDQLQAAVVPAFTIGATGNWDELNIDGQRALIAAVVDRADVAPGRGRDRVAIHPRGE